MIAGSAPPRENATTALSCPFLVSCFHYFFSRFFVNTGPTIFLCLWHRRMPRRSFVPSSLPCFEALETRIVSALCLLCGTEHKGLARGSDRQGSDSTACPALQLWKGNDTELAALGCCFFWHFIPISTSENFFTRPWKDFGQACVLYGARRAFWGWQGLGSIPSPADPWRFGSVLNTEFGWEIKKL